MGIVIAILILGFLIFFHELGHFLLARKSGIIVEGFSIGFGPSLIKWKKGDTEYSLKLIPLGGACMMRGEDGEEAEKGTFNGANIWGRIATVAAGPIFNLVLGFGIAYLLICLNGYQKPVIQELVPNMPAIESELKVGDKIISINNKKIHLAKEVSLYTTLHPKRELELVVERGEGEYHTISIVPVANTQTGGYSIGIVIGEQGKANPLNAFSYALYEMGYWVDITFGSLKLLVTGGASVKNMTGPIGIVGMIDKQIQEATPSGMKVIIMSILGTSMFISINLGLMNLLPIPALDGGRLIFLLIEAALGRPLHRKIEGYVHTVGMVILFSFMIFVIFQDVIRMIR